MSGSVKAAVHLPDESGGAAIPGAKRSPLRVAARDRRRGGGPAIDPMHSLGEAYPADRRRSSTPKRRTRPGWCPAATTWRVGSPFLPPARRRLLLALVNAVAFALDHGHVGVMQQAVQQGHDAGSVGEDFVPLFERLVGGEDHRFSFVAPVDDFVE